MPYKFIYFDLDGTLLDHRSAEEAGLTEVYHHFDLFNDIEVGTFIDAYQRVNGKLWEQYGRGNIEKGQLQGTRFRKSLEQLGLDISRHTEIGQYYLKRYSRHWNWISDAKKVFDAIRSKYPVGILTNGFTEMQKKKFDAFNLYQTTDYQVISEEIGTLKPDPRVFEYATEKAGFGPSEILYVGDEYRSDIEGGTNFGWNTAWFTPNGETDNDQLADFTFSNFNGLTTFLEK